ncbi:MAG: response regulator [Candidatus Omnitrophota bacterium]|nr:response regulator [Candidatus Omnitrophota bacterium]
MLKEKILIADDDPDILDVIRITLEAEGYQVIEAHDGEEAVGMVKKSAPDLLITDFKMPKMCGDEVCKTLKQDILIQHMPIIMLTGKGEITDKIHGINAGADDYIVKPFEPQELVARVKMVLRRTARDLDANPLTRLPGNVSIINEVGNRIDKKEFFAVCYADLDKFKAFNDKYGFEKGDEVIKNTARILINSVQEKGTPQDFIGHIGGDDFVVITTPDKVDGLCKKIIADFGSMVPGLYNKEDLEKGYIIGQDRQKKTRKIPLLSISIGVVTNEKIKINHVGEVGELGAELKEYAKSLPGSNYVKERREKTS